MDVAAGAIVVIGQAMNTLDALRSPAAFATAQSGTDFFSTEAHHRSVAERILGALSAERALVVTTGEPAPRGSDMAAALRAAAGSRYRVAVIACNAEFGPETLQQAASELDEPAAGPAASLLSRIRPPLPLFLLDKAECLSDAQLGAIALIADMAVAAVVLLAEPSFRARLESAPLLTLNKRLAAAFAFQELGGEEIDAFIRHQLNGAAGEGAFSADIVAAIAKAAGGDPALVNLLARYVLDYAASRGEMPPRSLLAGAPRFREEQLSAAGALVPVSPVPPPARRRARPVAAGSGVATKRLGERGPLVLAFVAGLAMAGGTAILSRTAKWPFDRTVPVKVHAAAPLSAAEIAILLRRGDSFLRSGDIASARLFFRPAAVAGNREAAFRLAETYDPDFLYRAGVRGVRGDLRLARKWYLRAGVLGSSDAASHGNLGPPHP